MLPNKIYKPVLFLLVFFVFFILVPVKKNYGVVTSCGVSVVGPNPVRRNVFTEAYFNINNTSSEDVKWVRITTPSSDNFYIGGGNSSDWQSTVQEANWVAFNGKTLSPGTNANFSAAFQTIDADTAAQSFIIEVSDDNNGSSPTTCTGDSAISISGEGVPPEMSDLTISDISSSSVTIKWTTDELANSTVDYGLTIDYGLTKTDATMVTAHTIALDSLTANTTYTYRLKSTDAMGNTAESVDNYFTTAKVGSTTTVTVVVTPTPTPTPGPAPTPIPDKTPPSISLKTDFSTPYLQAPTITGSASDNKEVNKVEYSLNEGKTWIAIDSSQNLGTKAVAFDFTPQGLEDGNYKIKVRAGDGSGNVGTSKTYVLIIDRLPPRLGAMIFTLGPQIVEPYEGNYMVILAGLNQKLTLSAVGGPTSVDFFIKSQMFSLAKNVDSGLWSGALNFKEPGIYEPEIRMIDGADNKLRKKINPIMVLPNGTVQNSEGPIENASVSLYSFDLVTQRFVLWDGQSYGQDNPQKTANGGKYKLFVPAGKYYLEVKARGYKTLKTTIFTLNQSLPINDNFVLEKATSFKIGPFEIFLPDFSYKEVPLKMNTLEIPQALEPGKDLVGMEWPKGLADIDFKGKKTLVTFLNTWLPQASEQIQVLEKLNSDINVVVIVPQESNSQVQIYQKRSGGSLIMIADPDSELFQKFNIQFLPAHLYLDQRGIIQKLKLGVFTKEELYNNF